MPLPTDPLIRAIIRRLFETDADKLAVYTTPAGDPGLFGPDSVTWRIHYDFPGMMSGGLCALLLQTLHPRALAGVWDHSNFREDLLGRLRRTTEFVAATSFGPRAHAMAQIDRVRRIHQRVHGTLPDGRTYDANEPDLLTWVHITEMWSFVEGWQAYRGVRLSRPVLDRYYAETAKVARLLGAKHVPVSAAGVERYFKAVQGELEFSERSRTVIDVLDHVKMPTVLLAPARTLFLGSGAALLPDWAIRLMGRTRRQRALDQAAKAQLRLMGPLIRRALRDGVGSRSCARVGLPLDALDEVPTVPSPKRMRATA